MPKNCKNCGAEMPEEAHFCLNCLTETEEKTVIVIDDKPPFFANRKTAALIAAVLIVLLIIVCIFCFTSKGNTPANSQPNSDTDKAVISALTKNNKNNTTTKDNSSDKTKTSKQQITKEKVNTTTSKKNSSTEKTSQKATVQQTDNTSTTTNEKPITTPIKSWSKWSTEEPKKGTYSDIETTTEYRYRTKTTITSYATSLSGYTQNGYTLVDDTSGTIDYVDNFPSGFDKNNVFYKEYNKTPKYTSETSTQKTNVSTEIVGYLYWHWSYPLSGAHSEDNRPYSDTYNEQIGNYGRATVFEAFQSDIPLNWNSLKLAFHCTGHSTYSYWWTAVCYDSSQQLPVKRCIWTTQNKLYNYYKISDWSEWSTAKPTDFYDMETRTIYRYK